MLSRLPFIKARQKLHLSQAGNASDVIVRWVEIIGGMLDAPTGALVSGVSCALSGTMRAHGLIEPATTVERRHAEIQTGDLILDVDSVPMVQLYAGQAASGIQLLDTIAQWQPRFEFGGALYVQKEVGDELACTWDAIVKNQKLHRTILLRRAT